VDVCSLYGSCSYFISNILVCAKVIYGQLSCNSVGIFIFYSDWHCVRWSVRFFS